MIHQKPFAMSEIVDPDQVRVMVYNGERIGHAPLQSILSLVSVSGGGGASGGRGTQDMSKPDADPKGGCSLGKTITLVFPENGVGDMRSVIYDPTCVAKDAFDMDSMKEGKEHLILTNSEREKVAKIDQMETDITANKAAVVEIRGVADQAKAQSQEALTQSVKAVDTSNTAKANSENAVRISGEAKTEADKAVVTSRDANVKSDQAVTTANEAKDLATQAKTKSDNTEQRVATFTAETDTRVTNLTETTTKKLSDLEDAISEKVTDLHGKVKDHIQKEVDDLTTRVDGVQNTANQGIAEAKAAAAAAQKCCDDLKPTVNEALATANTAKAASDKATATAKDAHITAEEAKVHGEAAEHNAAVALNQADAMTKTAEDLKKLVKKIDDNSTHAHEIAWRANEKSDDAEHVAKRAEEQVKIVNFYATRNKRKIDSLGTDLKALDKTVKNLTFTAVEPWKPFLYAKDKTRMVLRKNTSIGVGNIVYTPKEDVEFSVGRGVVAGKDYYVYLVLKGENVTISVSDNSTFPRGATAANSRKIGGFHALCADVGVIAGHPLSGYTAKSILPLSVWCLNHRPCCSPEGMVWCSAAGIWVDIYLQSGTGTGTRSAFGGAVVNKRPYNNHLEDYHAVNKRLLHRSEFIQAVMGTSEGMNAFGKTQANYQQGTNITTGGNVANDKGQKGRRMISNIGVEDGCGYFAQSLDDLVIIYHYSSGKNIFNVVGAGGLPVNVGAVGATAANIRPYGLSLLAGTSSPEPHVTARGCSPNIVRGS